MFLVLFLGNITTTIMVIPQKRREHVKDYLFASRGENAQVKENKNEKNEWEKGWKDDTSNLLADEKYN